MKKSLQNYERLGSDLLFFGTLTFSFTALYVDSKTMEIMFWYSSCNLLVTKPILFYNFSAIEYI